MKKISKLQINSDRLMKNDELIFLRGGYEPIGCCFCFHDYENMGAMAALDVWDCAIYCDEVWPFGDGNYSEWHC